MQRHAICMAVLLDMAMCPHRSVATTQSMAMTRVLRSHSQSRSYNRSTSSPSLSVSHSHPPPYATSGGLLYRRFVPAGLKARRPAARHASAARALRCALRGARCAAVMPLFGGLHGLLPLRRRCVSVSGEGPMWRQCRRARAEVSRPQSLMFTNGWRGQSCVVRWPSAQNEVSWIAGVPQPVRPCHRPVTVAVSRARVV